MATARMLPNVANLFAEAYPAMRTATDVTPPTATTYNTPMFRSARKLFSPKGMTASTRRVGASMTTGASVNTSRSAPRGMMSSLVRSFRASAIGCMIPKGPARFGPSLPWNRPSSRRSPHV